MFRCDAQAENTLHLLSDLQHHLLDYFVTKKHSPFKSVQRCRGQLVCKTSRSEWMVHLTWGRYSRSIMLLVLPERRLSCVTNESRRLKFPKIQTELAKSNKQAVLICAWCGLMFHLWLSCSVMLSLTSGVHSTCVLACLCTWLSAVSAAQQIIFQTYYVVG